MNTTSPVSSDDSRQIFKIDRPSAFIIWMAVMTLGLLCFMTMEVMNKAYLQAGYFATGFLFFLVLSMVSVASLSDIAIDEDGISRMVLGKTWRTIRWSNVRIIKVFDSFDRGSNKVIRAFNIYPAVKPKFLISGKVVFGERMERPKDFIELLNKYIDQYGINIEAVVGGLKTSPARL